MVIGRGGHWKAYIFQRLGNTTTVGRGGDGWLGRRLGKTNPTWYTWNTWNIWKTRNTWNFWSTWRKGILATFAMQCLGLCLKPSESEVQTHRPPPSHACAPCLELDPTKHLIVFYSHRPRASRLWSAMWRKNPPVELQLLIQLLSGEHHPQPLILFQPYWYGGCGSLTNLFSNEQLCRESCGPPPHCGC